MAAAATPTEVRDYGDKLRNHTSIIFCVIFS